MEKQAPVLWMDLGIRTAGDPLRVAPAVIAAIRSVDPEQPIADIRTMEKAIHNSAIGLNYVAVLMGVFGVLALVLSAIGVYGVMAYAVQQRTREIGVRLALGAAPSAVRRMVVFQGMRLAILGVVIGVGGAYMLAHYMATMLFGVAARDLAVFIAVPLLLSVIALLAVWIPAARASRIDPLGALRST